MADNNKEIISNLIKRIENKKDVKQNIINRFFIDENIKAQDIYPTIKYRYNNIQDEMNIPINILDKPLSNYEELDINIGDKDILFNQLNDNYYLSEQDIINQNIINNINIAKNNNKQDIKEFQLLVKDIIKNSPEYKKTLNNIKGDDFEYLISLISQGKNIDNIMNLEYIPYDKIKDNIDKEINIKDIENLLKPKKIQKQNYDIFKKYYSTKSKMSLFDIYNLSDSNTLLYFEKINVINSKIDIGKGKFVKPKTDIKITFFTISKKDPLDIAYKNRILYTDDTLNISLKQNTFIGYHHIKFKFNNNSENNVYKQIFNMIKTLTSDNNLSNNIAFDCLKTYKRKYDIIENISEIHIYITPNHTANMIYPNSNKYFGYNTFSNKKLKDLDNSENNKSSIKFLTGNFVDFRGNTNALLHVKNQSSLGNINSLLKNIEPISEYNTDLIEQIKNLNIGYTFITNKIKLFNFEKVQKLYSEQEIKDNKYIIYDSKDSKTYINENLKFNKYLFKTLDDLFDFSNNIVKKLSIKTRTPIAKNYKSHDILYYKILKKNIDVIIKSIYNIDNKKYIPVYKVSLKK